MPNVVDTLVTRFQMDGTDYDRGAKTIIGNTDKIGSAIGNVRSGITSILSRFQDIAKAGALVGAGLLGAAVAAGSSAVKAAIDFDTVQRSLVAVTKSAERAKEILKFDDKLAGPSIFSSMDLAQASLHLEAFKLNTEKFLPVAEKLGTIFGSNKEALDSFVSALGFIKNGRFGEGFESLTRAGLSRDDFKAEGLHFDKGGEFKGSADQALTAIEKMVNERFGKLSDEMAKGPAAKIASVMDSIGRAARVAGSAILSFLVPAFDKVGQFVSYLVDSGSLERLSNSFASFFNGEKIGDTLVKTLSWVVATFESLPSLIKNAADTFSQRFNEMRLTVIKLASFMAALFAGEFIIKGVLAIIEVYKVLTTTIKAAAVAQATLTALTGAGVAIVLAALAAGALTAKALDKAIPIAGKAEIKMPENDISARAKQIEDGFKKSLGTPGETQTVNANGQTNPNSPSSQLAKIAEYTGRTAKATEKSARDLEDAQTGGSSVKNAVSAQQLASVTGQGQIEYHLRKVAEILSVSSLSNTGRRLRRAGI